MQLYEGELCIQRTFMSDYAFKMGQMVDYRPPLRFANKVRGLYQITQRECRQRMASSNIALKAQTNLTNALPMRMN